MITAGQSASDQELVERVRAGDSGSFELLMRRYNQRLYRIVRSVVRDDSEAEDILQDAWVRAYGHLEQFEGRASFPTWVSRIAFNEALARARKSRRWAPLEDSGGNIMPEANRRRSSAETPETQVIRDQLGAILQSAVDSLPETYRVVFVLREIEQLNTNETAESLGISEEAVKTRLHRSRALLRREVTDRMGPAVAGTYPFLGVRCDRIVAHVMARIGAPGARPA